MTTPPSMDETVNGDAVLTLGRVLYAALDDAGAPLRPDARTHMNYLAREEPFAEASLVLERPNGRQWLTPADMRVLIEFGIEVEPRAEDAWEFARYAEFRVDVPDDVWAAYEAAAAEWGTADAPKRWDTDEGEQWTHANVMATFGEGE